MNWPHSFLAFSFSVLFAIQSFAQTDTIRIFTLKGCARCELTKAFVKDHAINAKFYDYNDPAYERKFGAIMNKTGFKGTLEFPVVLWNGITHYNIPNLNQFLNSMSEGNQSK